MAERPTNQDPQQKPSQNGPDGPNRQPGSPPPMRFGRGFYGWALAALFIIVVFLFVSQLQGSAKTITWGEFKELWSANLIERDSVIVRPAAVEAIQRPGSDEGGAVRVSISRDTLSYYVEQVDTLTEGQFVDRSAISPWIQYLPHLIFWAFLIAVIFFFIRGVRGVGGGGGMLGNFGKSRHRTLTKEMTGVTFKDVAGIEEAKEEVSEIIEFLRNPKKFTRLGGRIPRGVLLVGQPGCGKTLLAKAIAGEADVPFFSISGSDFVEMFVGVGASRVRDLFKQAKESVALHHLPRRDRRGRSPPRRRVQPGRARRARADAQRDPRRDGRVQLGRRRDRHRGDEPGGRARPRADAPGPLRPADHRAAARRQRAPGDPQGPRQEGHAGPRREPRATRAGHAHVQRARTWRRSSTRPRSAQRCRTRSSSSTRTSRRPATR
jgi:hypothetical protein